MTLFLHFKDKVGNKRLCVFPSSLLSVLPMTALLTQIADIAAEAGTAILAVAQTGARARVKPDRSPVTDADEAANGLIVSRLAALTPDIPAVAEESVNTDTPPAPRFWLVDPLDGTREFIAGRDEYTVNIALIICGRPVLGVVAAPARGVCFAGLAGGGAWRHDAQGRHLIAARRAPANGPAVLASRSHRDTNTESWLSTSRATHVTRMGSSLKFCIIAAGDADVYPRFGRTMEWDTAAGHAVLAAAGGGVQCVDGAPLTYGKRGFENPPFIAHGAVREEIQPAL